MLCSSSNTKNGNGFTLIELLVVISIIALLVSIIMPALNRAKDNAKRTVCANNLKSIGQGLFMYATNNNDKIPQTDYDMGAPGTPNKTYMMFLINPDINLKPMDRILDTKGLGYLYGKRYIDAAEAFYCDGIPKSALSWRYELFEGGGGFPWNTGITGQNTHYVRCSFSYLPQSRKKKMGLAIPGDYTPTQGIIRADGKEYFPAVAKTMAEFYGEYAIASGLLHSLNALPHKMGSKNASGVNVLFGDSSVRFCNNRDAFDEPLWDESIGDGPHEYEFRKVYSLLK